jgi:catechol 2,3-dioxygenase-like lactoylglutathione lyase family enzyme
MSQPQPGTLHHVEIWVPDLQRAIDSLGWLLEAMGYKLFQTFKTGRSWLLESTYIVLEQSPARSADHHDRLRPGLNHLAFHAGPPADVEALVHQAGQHGWRLLFPDRHPYAGGEDYYAAYLENDDGFEVELVAATP